MLRVYSVLYIEKLWRTPVTNRNIIIPIETNEPIYSIAPSIRSTRSTRSFTKETDQRSVHIQERSIAYSSRGIKDDIRAQEIGIQSDENIQSDVDIQADVDIQEEVQKSRKMEDERPMNNGVNVAQEPFMVTWELVSQKISEPLRETLPEQPLIVVKDELSLAKVEEAPVVKTEEAPAVKTEEAPVVKTEEAPLAKTEEALLVEVKEAPSAKMMEILSMGASEETQLEKLEEISSDKVEKAPSVKIEVPVMVQVDIPVLVQVEVNTSLKVEEPLPVKVEIPLLADKPLPLYVAGPLLKEEHAHANVDKSPPANVVGSIPEKPLPVFSGDSIPDKVETTVDKPLPAYEQSIAQIESKAPIQSPVDNSAQDVTIDKPTINTTRSSLSVLLASPVEVNLQDTRYAFSEEPDEDYEITNKRDSKMSFTESEEEDEPRIEHIARHSTNNRDSVIIMETLDEVMEDELTENRMPNKIGGKATNKMMISRLAQKIKDKMHEKDDIILNESSFRSSSIESTSSSITPMTPSSHKSGPSPIRSPSSVRSGPSPSNKAPSKSTSLLRRETTKLNDKRRSLTMKLKRVLTVNVNPSVSTKRNSL
ncbi:hypothetical protein BDB01DRAFT_832285 [Pilobolus umbonatus]|nr:hypothetical protein BDB01DRAFT_832285 [Pilobolus umbonatus]